MNTIMKRARCWLLCESPELDREREAYARLSAEAVVREHEHVERTSEFQRWFQEVEKDAPTADALEAAVKQAGLNGRVWGDD